MPIAALPWILAGAGVAAAGLGFFADKTGEAVNDTSNAALKMAAAGVLTYVVLKNMKVLK